MCPVLGSPFPADGGCAKRRHHVTRWNVECPGLEKQTEPDGGVFSLSKGQDKAGLGVPADIVSSDSVGTLCDACGAPQRCTLHIRHKRQRP